MTLPCQPTADVEQADLLTAPHRRQLVLQREDSHRLRQANLDGRYEHVVERRHFRPEAEGIFGDRLRADASRRMLAV